jgi:hypothetical protein
MSEQARQQVSNIYEESQKGKGVESDSIKRVTKVLLNRDFSVILFS